MISYAPLRAILGHHKKNYKEIREELGIGTNTLAKIKNDTGYVSLEVIDKICNYLSDEVGREIKIEEVLMFALDQPAEQKEKE
ncbi:DNA-binding transcriptional regulator, XRE family [Anaerovirgula multivorans]|uniref:DNA-binding transcriptional regulator, XRE family n=1 Tax=Anaerovirgula multivorans TaxID=312168 RepID=A0A239KY39_9FIRM|nr:helix-turn-helix transcriptional regulator [Anaerovirgula multivorans]SNT23121.1 DNA-binding transcriptional regulator, XRE family [Anaerovirgula multivorans]